MHADDTRTAKPTQHSLPASANDSYVLTLMQHNNCLLILYTYGPQNRETAQYTIYQYTIYHFFQLPFLVSATKSNLK